MSQQKEIAAVLRKHTLEWMTLPGVLGAAEGIHRGKPCVVVLVVKKTRELQKFFPERIGGVRLVLKQVGARRGV